MTAVALGVDSETFTVTHPEQAANSNIIVFNNTRSTTRGTVTHSGTSTFVLTLEPAEARMFQTSATGTINYAGNLTHTAVGNQVPAENQHPDAPSAQARVGVTIF